MPDKLLWTGEMLNTLMTMSDAGESFKTIGSRLGVSKSAVRKKLVDMGIEHRNKKRIDWTDEKAARFIELRRAGRSYREIADVLRISRSSIALKTRELKADGIPAAAPKEEAGLVKLTRFRWNKENEGLLIRLIDSGATNEAISRILKCSRYTFERKIRELRERGIAINRKKQCHTSAARFDLNHMCGYCPCMKEPQLDEEGIIGHCEQFDITVNRCDTCRDAGSPPKMLNGAWTLVPGYEIKGQDSIMRI